MLGLVSYLTLEAPLASVVPIHVHAPSKPKTPPTKHTQSHSITLSLKVPGALRGVLGLSAATLIQL